MIWTVDATGPVVQDGHGQLARPADYPRLLEVVRRAYLNQADWEGLSGLLSETRWVFVKKDSDRFGIRNCAYFFTSPNHPALIKIGACKTLAQRMYQHRATYGPNLRVWAVAITPRYLELEASLHTLFEPFRASPWSLQDWFQADIVLDWLDDLEEAVRNQP